MSFRQAEQKIVIDFDARGEEKFEPQIKDFSPHFCRNFARCENEVYRYYIESGAPHV